MLALCSNQEPGSQHRCVFRGSVCTVLLPSYEVLVPSDNFTITLHQCVAGQEQVRLVDQQYLPRKNGEQGCLEPRVGPPWEGTGPGL